MPLRRRYYSCFLDVVMSHSTLLSLGCTRGTDEEEEELARSVLIASSGEGDVIMGPLQIHSVKRRFEEQGLE